MFELAGKLTAKDFPLTPIDIKFEDGSSAFFRYSFYTVEMDYNNNIEYYAVYTEHCGYHKFNKITVDSIVGQEGKNP